MLNDLNLKFKNNSHLIAPFIITHRSIFIKNSFKKAEIKRIGIKTFLCVMYELKKEEAKRLLFAINKEPSLYRMYVKNNLLCCEFDIPKHVDYRIDYINMCNIAYLPNDVIINNARFWGDYFCL